MFTHIHSASQVNSCLALSFSFIDPGLPELLAKQVGDGWCPTSPASQEPIFEVSQLCMSPVLKSVTSSPKLSLFQVNCSIFFRFFSFSGSFRPFGSLPRTSAIREPSGPPRRVVGVTKQSNSKHKISRFTDS